MDTLWQDVRHAVRGYAKTPIFTLTVLVILALGIGANSAIFSVVNTVLLRPLDFPDAAALVGVGQAHRVTGRRALISPPNFFDLRAQARSFSGIAAYWSPELTISGGSAEPQKVLAATCSDDLFTVLGVAPALGRPLLPSDGGPGVRRVALVSHAMWQRRFGGDPRAVGQDILIDGAATQVVGVMPPGVSFPAAGTELSVPLRLSRTQPPNPAVKPEAYRQYRILTLVGRLRPGVTLAQARAELDARGAHLERSFPEANHDLTFAAAPLQDVMSGSAKPGLWLIFAAVGCVLLIACANVGSLLLVRASGRAREVTIRMALGAAGRGQARFGRCDRERDARACRRRARARRRRWRSASSCGLAPEGVPHLERMRIDACGVDLRRVDRAGGGRAVRPGAGRIQVRSRRLQEVLVSAGRGAVSVSAPSRAPHAGRRPDRAVGRPPGEHRAADSRPASA